MAENEKEAAQLFAQYTVNLKYEDIPADVRESTKRSILDTLAVTVAGSSQNGQYRALVELIKDAGGKEESTILGFGYRVPSWMAAFANAALNRVLHYDDTYDEAVTHPSCTTVPAACAIAERKKNVSGKDLITAITLGNDITSRMGLSICERPQGWKPGWYQTPVHGVFGAAVACGKLLGFDVAKMQNALGIALHHSSGTLEGPGIPNAFAAKGAVLSALMADKGITGATDCLEGAAGLYNVYYGGDYNRDRLVAGLGSRFESASISLKPWPGLRYFHSYIDATLQLVREQKITAQNIKRITIFVAGYVQGGCEPLEARRKPTTLYEANISLPYLVALATTKRRVLIKDIVPEALNDTLVLQVAQRVFPKNDERFSITNKIGPALVAIELTNGQSYSKQMEIAYGHPRNPMTEEDFLIKIKDCASQSVKPPSDEDVERIIDMGRHLEELDDVSQFVRFLG